MNSIPTILIIVVGAVFLAPLVMMLTGLVRIWISAFRSSILWGLGCLFVPFCTLVYLIVHWQEAKSGFFLYLKGVFGLVISGLLAAVIIPNFEKTRTAQIAHAKERTAVSQPVKYPSATNSIEKDQPVASPQKNPTDVIPSRPTLQLQGIVYNPAKPSAIINGNTVSVGDKVAEWSVTAISNQTVTLQNGSGEINTLSMKLR